MSAMTMDVIVDRVRSILVAEPFGFVESQVWETFEANPESNIDRVFRILPPASQSVIPGFDYIEDRTESMQILIARHIGGEWDQVRRTLLKDVHSITAAVVRDAYGVSGDYAVPNEGRGHAIEHEDPSASYLVLRLTLPINYEAQL